MRQWVIIPKDPGRVSIVNATIHGVFSSHEVFTVRTGFRPDFSRFEFWTSTGNEAAVRRLKDLLRVTDVSATPQEFRNSRYESDWPGNFPSYIGH